MRRWCRADRNGARVDGIKIEWQAKYRWHTNMRLIFNVIAKKVSCARTHIHTHKQTIFILGRLPRLMWFLLLLLLLLLLLWTYRGGSEFCVLPCVYFHMLQIILEHCVNGFQELYSFLSSFVCRSVSFLYAIFELKEPTPHKGRNRE